MTFQRCGITCVIGSALLLACTSAPAPRPNAMSTNTARATRGGESVAPVVTTAPRVARAQNEPSAPRTLDSIHVFGDRLISRGAAAAIAATPNLGANAVVIDTDRGVVVLEGNVATESDRRAIEDAVRSVRGVERIEDKLQVRE